MPDVGDVGTQVCRYLLLKRVVEGKWAVRESGPLKLSSFGPCFLPGYLGWVASSLGIVMDSISRLGKTATE